jgi:multidrug efflux pump
MELLPYSLLPSSLQELQSQKCLFFPDNQPNTINIFIKMPEGTDQLVTDSVTRLVEKKVDKIFGKNNPLVESIVTNVGFGAGDGMFDRTTVSNKGKVAINFIESRYRHGEQYRSIP